MGHLARRELTVDASEFDGTVRLRVEGLHLQASNIAFWVSKKTGFLPFEDSGLLDVQFGPQGLSFDVTLENANDEDRETFFTVKEVHTWITGFDFQLRESKASFAAWFARPVIRAFIRVSLPPSDRARLMMAAHCRRCS